MIFITMATVAAAGHATSWHVIPLFIIFKDVDDSYLILARQVDIDGGNTEK